jgi:ribonuclease HII
MTEALNHLQPAAEYLLIDGRIRLRHVPLAQQSIVRGDSTSLSIAAASILAKVERDRYMIALSELYPQYGYASHKGYATPQHLAALAEYGSTQYHRHTFAPVRRTLL